MFLLVVCRTRLVGNIIITVSVDHVEYMRHVVKQFNHQCVTVTEGAETRHRSIYNAVKAIPHGGLTTSAEYNLCKKFSTLVELLRSINNYVTTDSCGVLFVVCLST